MPLLGGALLYRYNSGPFIDATPDLCAEPRHRKVGNRKIEGYEPYRCWDHEGGSNAARQTSAGFAKDRSTPMSSTVDRLAFAVRSMGLYRLYKPVTQKTVAGDILWNLMDLDF